MGEVSVVTMVQEAINESESRKLHPFFSKDPTQILPSSTLKAQDVTKDGPASDAEVTSGRRKRPDHDATTDETPVPKKTRRPRKSGRESLNATITSHLVKPTDHATPNSSTPGSHTLAPTAIPLSDAPIRLNEQTADSVRHGTTSQKTDDQRSTTPKTSTQAKKVLKFNPKTGTLGSPPKPKKSRSSYLVTIRYGSNDKNRKTLGQKIGDILEGKLEVAPLSTPVKQRSRRNQKRAGDTVKTQALSGKTKHPLFTGQSKPAVAETGQLAQVTSKLAARKHSIFMSTPVSPRKSKAHYTVPTAPSFGSGFSKPVGTKIPGAKHPAWPCKGMVHTRGNEEAESKPQVFDVGKIYQTRKSKGSIVNIATEKSVINHCTQRLDLDSIRRNLQRSERLFVPAPQELRTPTRHFESGRKLRERILPQLRTVRPRDVREESDIDELAQDSRRQCHPAIRRWLSSLESQLSAYDKSTCENLAWSHKYAPTGAEEVLQSGKEAIFLRQWLEGLKIQSVDTGVIDASKSKEKPEKITKKRRRNKLDGFIVESDDEANGMDEVSDEEAEWVAAGSGTAKKTVLRTSGMKDHKKLANAIVISGPHGSGKTAAVYAVAKELGFEVFEINAGGRRSGKDTLEKVGDMTRNHLVQHHQAEAAAAEQDDEVAKDLKSGKQGTMTTFFKPKPAIVEKPSKRVEEQPRGGTKAAKSQKQSLILIEEVDILYEEDKQFWATLMSLIAQAKRPFIMTCNDETLVPIQSLNLHGILRFSPAPIGLAVDLCLLVAANEGHALQRSAVEALYSSRNHDIRATLTELNYWCQIGIGDRRGGFDWFYLRWPRGSDVDENGDVVRVVSEDTYRKGMGWISRDPVISETGYLERELEVTRQCWDSWQVTAGDWHASLSLKALGNEWLGLSSEVTELTDDQVFADFAQYDEFCEALSVSDLCSNHHFGNIFDDVPDPSVPDYLSKVKEDFIIGRTLLEADLRPNYASPSADISNSLSSVIRQKMLDYGHRSSLGKLNYAFSPLDEDQTVSILEAYMQLSHRSLTRRDLSLAFDPIAVSDNALVSAHLDPSVFDRTFSLIVTDVAPWVRSIVNYDHQLMFERRKLSSLLSEGGQGKKRMRNTRAAYSALEGGERKNTRRDKYFRGVVNTGLVLRTGAKEWQDAMPQNVVSYSTEGTVVASQESE